MVELILHIGMGKTGTSSIQSALSTNADRLSRQNVEYLGMWFTSIDPRFYGLAGQERFFRSSFKSPIKLADRFADYLGKRAAETGHQKFILSCEGIFENVTRLTPFLSRLRDRVSLRLIAYVRDPTEWLPSAYNQWMIYHKTNTGPIKEFSEGARYLISMYDCIKGWGHGFSKQLVMRRFEIASNVVEDFAQVAEIEIEYIAGRVFERIDLGESVLRAIYNNRLNGEALPDLFNHAVGPVDLVKAPRLDDLLKSSFSYDDTDAIVAEKSEVFEYLRDNYAINFHDDDRKKRALPDLEAVRNRALEHLLLLTLDQADRIRRLERELSALQEVVSTIMAVDKRKMGL